MSAMPEPCSVCQLSIGEPRQRGACDECGRPFHLNLRTDIDAVSCGAAYVSAACGMNVYCNPCGARLEAESGLQLARVQ
jgi:hypothetical protein